MALASSYANLTMWYRADVIGSLWQANNWTVPVTANGQNVSSITDQSGANNNSALLGNSPTYAAAPMPNRPAVRCGVGAVLNSSYFYQTGANSRTVIIVLSNYVPHADSYNVIWEHGTYSASQSFGLYAKENGGHYYVAIWSGGASGGYRASATSPGGIIVVSLRYSNPVLQMRVNNSLTNWNNSLVLNTGSAFPMRIGGTGTQRCSFDMHEFAAWTRALSDSELSEATETMMSTWGVRDALNHGKAPPPAADSLLRADRSPIIGGRDKGKSQNLFQGTGYPVGGLPVSEAGSTTYYKMQGWRPGSGTYETWTVAGAPSLANPSGLTIQDVRVVGTWQE